MNRIQRLATLRVILLAGTFAVVMIVTAGCGKKDMPVAPNRQVPPPIVNLVGKIDDGRMILHWMLPALRDKDTAVVDVQVYRSKIPLTVGDCENCPRRFEQIATISPPNGTEQSMHYIDPMETGFRYAYRVNLASENGAVSPPSNLITVTY